MSRVIAVIGVMLLGISSAAASESDLKNAVAVLDIQGTGIEEALLPTLTEILTVEIHALGKYKVIAGRDIQSMLGFEKQKDVLGCTDAACLAEIGGALGVERIVAGHIGKVGSTYVVNIKLINIRMADTEARVYETVKGEEDALIETIRRSVTKLFGNGGVTPKATASAAPAPAPAPQAEAPAPAPQPKVAQSTHSHSGATEPDRPVAQVEQEESSGGLGVLPWLLWGGGAAVVGAGAFLGFAAKQQAEHANDSSYVGGQKEAETAPKVAGLANLSFGVGVALVGGGVLMAILRSGGDDAASTALAPMVGPQTVGMAFSGSF